MENLYTYLTYHGDCREAFEFYKECLNTEITIMQTYENSPIEIAVESKDLIFNAELRKGNMVLKASDTLPEYIFNPGNNFSLFLTFRNPELQREVFDELVEGGSVMMSLPPVGEALEC